MATSNSKSSIGDAEGALFFPPDQIVGNTEFGLDIGDVGLEPFGILRITGGPLQMGKMGTPKLVEIEH